MFDDLIDLLDLRPETLEPLLGTEFRTQDPEATFVLRTVERFALQPHAPRTAPFTLLFDGPYGLPQRIYRLEHATLGQMELFLVPIAPGRDGAARYEAVFN
jgi:hypothetical protein